jgi:hypothetical protein
LINMKVEQELIQAYLEYEKLARQLTNAQSRLNQAKNDFAKIYSEGCYIVGDYVVDLGRWDPSKIAPVKIKLIKQVVLQED